MKAHISQNRVDLECDILKDFNDARAIIKEDACMKFYDGTKLLHIEMVASGVGLGATLLPTRNHTSCAKDEAPDNSILRPTTFASISLTRAEKDTTK